MRKAFIWFNSSLHWETTVPSLRVHAYVDKVLFGKSYWKLHREIDKPVFYLGRGHRVLYHNFPSGCFFASGTYPGDGNALLAAQYHIILDEQCSQDPAYKEYLENMARLESKNNKRTRKRKAPKKKADPDLEFLEKLVELKRLHRILMEHK